MSAAGTDLLRTVSPTDNQPDMPEQSGVLYRRSRSLRWTDRFPVVAGWYWIRPKDIRFNTAIHYVPPGLPPEEFHDAEFSDRPVARPLEVGADDELELRPYATRALQTWLPEQAVPIDDDGATEWSRTQWLLMGVALGSVITIAVLAGMWFILMNH